MIRCAILAIVLVAMSYSPATAAHCQYGNYRTHGYSPYSYYLYGHYPYYSHSPYYGHNPYGNYQNHGRSPYRGHNPYCR